MVEKASTLDVHIGKELYSNRVEKLYSVKESKVSKIDSLLQALRLRRKTWALNNLDNQLNKYLNYKNGYFIELGANDGIAQSNTMYLEKYLRWNGLLIEPHLPNFLKLKENRSSGNAYCNCACVEFNFKSDCYNYVYSNLMTIGIDDRNDIEDRFGHAEKGRAYLEPGEQTSLLTSQARTLHSVLSEFNSPKVIDFLSLDVEGAELSVLDGINFEEYSFKFILVESRNLAGIESFLNLKNYKLVDALSIHDYLFKFEGS
jgi:FkbM family methyltransferase